MCWSGVRVAVAGSGLSMSSPSHLALVEPINPLSGRRVQKCTLSPEAVSGQLDVAFSCWMCLFSCWMSRNGALSAPLSATGSVARTRTMENNGKT